MNQNGTGNQSNYNSDQANREAAKMITLTAFLIGYILIDHLDSNEQSAVGNFFMLIGQTLCTSGGENFKRDWAPYQNPSNNSPNGNGSMGSNNYTNTNASPMSNATNSYDFSMTKDQTIDMLTRTRDVFDQQIDKLK